MAATTVDSSASQQRSSGSSPQEQRFLALAVSPHVERIPPSVVTVVNMLFADSRDRRVRGSGLLFLAHLLRLATIKQLPLAGTGTCEVAVLSIKSVLDLCRNRTKYNWPWCYDTTAKYLALLVTAGVLLKPKTRRGLAVEYHFPLKPYSPPETLAEDVQRVRMRCKRERVSRSTALQRIEQLSALSTSSACTVDSFAQLGGRRLQGTVRAFKNLLDAWFPGLSIEEQTVFESLRLALTDVLRASPLTRQQAETVQRPIPGGQIVDSSASSPHTGAWQKRWATTSPPIVDSSARPDEQLPRQQKTLTGSPALQDPTVASAVRNLRSELQQRDSALFVPTDSVRFSQKESFLTESLTESISGQEAKTALESTVNPPVRDSSAWRWLPWDFPALPLTNEKVRQWAIHLSLRYDHSDEKGIGFYTTLLREDPQALYLAVVDAVVRSVFPDPGKWPTRLGGGWVKSRYDDYHAKRPVLAQEDILAWAKQEYTLKDLDMILAGAAAWQDRRLGPRERRRRVLPHEVVVEEADLAAAVFWEQDGATGLIERGILFVRMEEGSVVPVEEYELLRIRSLASLLEPSADRVDEPRLQRELEAYLTWVEPKISSPEETERILARLPERIRNRLEDATQRLGTVLDLQACEVELVLTPLERRVALRVTDRSDPARVQQWTFVHPREVQAFVRARTGNSTGAMPCAERSPVPQADQQDVVSALGGDLEQGEEPKMDQEVCAALTRFFERTENELSSADAALVVEHVRSCSQCRSGWIVMPPPCESGMVCEHCQGNLGAYYDATHPERELGEMDGRAVLKTVRHLAQCEACRDVFNALLLLSAQEEQGSSIT